MTLRRPPRWVLMLLGGLTVAALLAWWWSEYIRTSTVRLADGRDVRVTAVTYGTNHVFIEGPLWVRAFRRQMSAAKAARFGLRVHQRSSAAPTCMVWTSWRITAAMVTNRTTPFASIANAQGIESQPIGPTVLSWILGRGGSTALMGWQWENFPRGHRKIQVRFYDLMTKDGGYRAPTLAGEVAVHIPAGRSGGQPVPAPPPPVRVSDGNTEFSLISLRCVERMDSPTEPSRPVAPLTTAMFSVVENAWPSTAWTLISLEGLGDAGNHFRIPEEGFGS